MTEGVTVVLPLLRNQMTREEQMKLRRSLIINLIFFFPKIICLHSFTVHFEHVDFEDSYAYRTFSF